MPLPGSKEIGYFEGSDVTEFVERFEDLYRTYGGDQGDEAAKVEKLVSYVYRHQRPVVKKLEGYESRDYRLFKSNLLKEYREFDSQRILGDRSYLSQLSLQKLDEPEEISEYIRNFEISSAMIPPEDLDNFSRTQMFLKPLSKPMRKKIQNKANLDMDRPHTFRDFARVISAAKAELRKDKTDKALCEDDRSIPAGKLVKAMRNTAPRLNPVSAATSATSRVSPDVEKLTEQLAALALALSKNQEPAYGPLRSSQKDEEALEIQAMVMAYAASEIKMGTACWECGLEGHRSGDCPYFNWLLDQEFLHKDKTRRMCPGRAGGETRPLGYSWDKKSPRLKVVLLALKQAIGPIDVSKCIGFNTLRASWKSNRRERPVSIDASMARFGTIEYIEECKPMGSLFVLGEEEEEEDYNAAYAATRSSQKTVQNPSRPTASLTKAAKANIEKQKQAAKTGTSNSRREQALLEMMEHHRRGEPSSSQGAASSQTQGRSQTPAVPNSQDAEMQDAQFGPAVPPRGKAKGAQRAKPKTQRLDNLLKKAVPMDEQEAFWSDRLLRAPLVVELGELQLFGQQALSRFLYGRKPADLSHSAALERYCASKRRPDGTATSAVNFAQIHDRIQEYNSASYSDEDSEASGKEESEDDDEGDPEEEWVSSADDWEEPSDDEVWFDAKEWNDTETQP
ncbi:hypothetical protein CERZMDRAFT_104117, partial [Cercospora zeae-maydis SCOH1-5]